MSFIVSEVIDGDTFKTSSNWKWGDDKNGDTVRIANYNAPETTEWGGKTATQKLKDLIEGKEVELKNPVNMSYGRIVCDVILNGTDIKELLN